jgi:hypothetical protein
MAFEQIEKLVREQATILVAILPDLLKKWPDSNNGPWGVPVRTQPIRDAVAMATALNAPSFFAIPTPLLQATYEKLAAFLEAMKNVQAIVPGNVDAGALSFPAVTAADEFSAAALPLVAYLSTRDTRRLDDVVRTLNEYTTNSQAKVAEISAFRTSIEGYDSEANRMLDDIRKISGEVGVAAHTKEFFQLARDHKDHARNWLVAMVVLGVCSFAAIGGAMWLDVLDDTARTARIVHYVMWRAVIFAVASFAIVWTARNYRAHRHLHVLNQHRSTALQTFRTFANAARDDATRNVVLLEATRSIFAAGSTGYSNDEPAGPADRFIEIVKMFKGGSS